MLISARAMKAAVALLEPLLIGSGYKPDSIAVMGTIKGDLHDIGKNLVGMMLKGANFESSTWAPTSRSTSSWPPPASTRPTSSASAPC